MIKQILISNNIFSILDFFIPVELAVGLISGILVLIITLRQPRDSNITYTERILLLIEIFSLILVVLPFVMMNILLCR